MLTERSEEEPSRVIYVWLDHHLKETAKVDLEHLLGMASSTSDFLLNSCRLQPRERVLLVYPPSIDFVYAFIGCLFAGVIPVPVYPPNPRKLDQDLETFSRIAANCGATVALTNKTYRWVQRFSSLRSFFSKTKFPQLTWATTGHIQPGFSNIQPHPCAPDETAFLQYTSGSTSTPKGVMITYRNIEHQLRINRELLHLRPDARGVTWLPQYHDFGLISVILSALYPHGCSYMLSPMSFAQNPAIWLEALSKYKGTHTAAPNFAFELAVKRTTPEQRAQWDLSKLEVLMSAAEPILPGTMERFFEAFAPSGLKREAFCPAYGLAEHTVGVTMKGKARCHVSRKELSSQNVVVTDTDSPDAVELIGCGKPPPSVNVRIVDVQAQQSLTSGQVGEIWVHSDSKAKGYYGREEETVATFQAELSDPQNELHYLRTGDFGFFHQGELFITGRLKDTIIVKGRNYSPHDLELVVQESSPLVRPGGVAAFSVSDEEENEHIVLFVELQQSAQHQEDIEQLAQTIQLQLQKQALPLCSIAAFGAKGLVLKTSSGKVRRQACRSAWLNKELPQHAFVWEATSSPNVTAEKESQNQSKATNSPDVLFARLRQLPNEQRRSEVISIVQEEAAELLQIQDIETIAMSQSMAELGLDSMSALEFHHKLTERTGFELPPKLGGASLAEVVQFLEEELVKKEPTRTFVASTDTNDQPCLLSPGQQRFWIMQQVLDRPEVNNIHIPILLQRSVTPKTMQQALEFVVHKHEQLRLKVEHTEAQQYQSFLPRTAFQLTVCELADFSPDVQQQQVETFSRKQAHTHFVLEEGPMLKLSLLRLGAQHNVLLFTCHHILLDGWSLRLLMQEFFATYEAMERGQTLPLPDVDRTYSTWSREMFEWLQSDKVEAQRTFWREQLAELSALTLPTPLSTPKHRSYRGGHYLKEVNSSIAQAVKILARDCSVTPFTVVLAAWATVLKRYTRQDDFVVATVTAGRQSSQTKHTVGFFANTIPIRCSLPAKMTVRENLTDLGTAIQRALEHQQLPYNEIIKCAPSSVITNRSTLDPLCSTAVIFEEAWLDRNSFPQDRAENGSSMFHIEGTTQFDLKLTIEPRDDGYQALFEFASDLWDTPWVERMAEHWHNTLTSMVTRPDTKLSNVEMLSKAEQSLLLYGLNDTQQTFERPNTIPSCFEQQVDKTPQQTAVIADGNAYTYLAINAKANQLARHLIARGVAPEDRVGVYCQRSVHLPIALLAILKSRAAYVPLDPDSPPERLLYMAEDAGVKVVLTTTTLANPGWPTTLTSLALDTLSLTSYNQHNLDQHPAPNSLAYILYTSGSTGKPKGVACEHAGLRNRILWMQEAYKLSASDRVLQKTSIGFDVSGWEFWWPLAVGATHVQAPPGSHKDPSELAEVIASQKITTLHFVPSMLGAFLDANVASRCRSLRHVFCSGEALQIAHRDSFHQQLHASLYNLYGPTEATIDVTAIACPPEQEGLPPIGEPVANTEVFIVTPELHLSPIGVPGELLLGGVQLARGYWNRAELTAERFIDNPFDTSSARLYRTGDLCRWRQDITIEFLGRIDHQVKLRGIRIELGEIESTLTSHPNVSQAIVQTVHQGETRLIAYLIPSLQPPPTSSSLKKYLSSWLPEPMIPSAFVFLDQYPLTPSGKTDLNALPLPTLDRAALQQSYVEPHTVLEKSLATVWANQLNLQTDQIGIHDDFFTLGGSSLSAIQVTSALKREHNISCSPKDLYRYPTIAQWARFQIQDSPHSISASELRAEVQLHPPFDFSATPNIDSAQGILLTGATGFLGPHLLHELSKSAKGPIYCLVRASHPEQAHQRLHDSLQHYNLPTTCLSRAIAIPGDLTLPKLGIASQKYEEIACEVKAIYHNAAWVNHLFDYTMLKSTNVQPIQELLQLAAHKTLKQFHFVSTTDVFPHTHSPATYTEDQTVPPPVQGSGYAQTKWVGEEILHRAHQQGLPIKIFRTGLLAGQDNSGQLPLQSYWLSQALRASIFLQMWPMFEQPLSFIPVNQAAQIICCISEYDAKRTIFHIVHERSLINERAFQELHKQYPHLQRCPLSEWLPLLLHYAEQKKDAELLALHTLLTSRQEQQGGEVFPRADIERQNTTNTLKEMNASVLLSEPSSMLIAMWNYVSSNL